MSCQNLKEILRPPFRPSRYGVVLHNVKEPIFILLETDSENWEETNNFIADALNEKCERDFSEPLRWKKNIGYHSCPKCKKAYNDERSPITGFNYCPHCGQRLEQPEKEI